MTDTFSERVGWIEVAAPSDIPNIVKLELPSDHGKDGSAWVYLTSKDTIYIGPPGSYHADIAHSLKMLVDKKHNEKPITGVLYNDGYADYFDALDDETSGRILRALKMYHDEQYGQSGHSSDDNWHWDDSDGYYLYPDESDYEDPDDEEEGTSGLDTNTWGHGHTYNDFEDQAWGDRGPKDEFKTMKPSPGAPKPIHQWDIQDYLDWRDKKYYNSGRSWGTPREDYPHFRWSYGDPSIMKGNPHDGLWVWPTQNGYPSHFDQTGQKGLGNCAQGRIYPHDDGKWEILTWPGRPRNAPSQAIREYIQEEAEKAVKQYVMDKMGVDEDKIFFTNMHYNAAVSNYDSPTYPGYSWDSSNYNNYVSKPFNYNWEPLADWASIPEGSWHSLKDPEGREWQISSLAPEKAGDIRLYAVDHKEPKAQEFDPNSTPVTGWQLGNKIYDDETNSSPNDSILDAYNKLKSEKDKGSVTISQPGDQTSPPPPNSNAVDWHQNPDGTYSRIVQTQTRGEVEFIYDGKYHYEELTPEQAWELRVRWHDEDEANRNSIAQRLFPEAYGGEGIEYDENKEPIPPTITSVHKSVRTGYPVITTDGPAGSNIHNVSPEEYELAYRLHGEDWWKYLFPNTHNAWKEIV